MKNSIRTGIAVLALAGTAALAPTAVAGADPVIGVSSGGVPVSEAGTIGRGQALDIVGSGCASPTPGQPTYSGEFVSGAGDPWSNPAIQPFETVNTEDGSFSWSLTVPEDNFVGTVYARWYCSTSPASELSGDMLWVGPLMSMNMSEGAVANRTASFAAKATTSTKTAAKTSSKAATTAAAGSNGGGMTVTVDPDALPVVDRLGITGDKAAKLKAKVDAQYARDALGLQLLKKLVGRNAELNKVLDYELQKQYVNTSASVLGAKKLSGKQVNGYADRLAAGEIRVTIVEDIALLVHPAAWYNAR
ncbi:MAG: hypothetical protein ACTHN0_01135 [Aquihabitans sp.]